MLSTVSTTTKKFISIACAGALAASICVTGAVGIVSSAWADAKSDLDAANQTASEASSAYDDAKGRADQVNADIEAKAAELTDLEDNQLPRAKAEFGNAVKQMYMGADDPIVMLSNIMAGGSLSEIISMMNAYDRITSWRMEALSAVKDTKEEIAAAKTQLEADKVEADAALAEAEVKKKEALDAQSKARAAYQATLPQNVPTTRRAPTATSFNDEASAKAFIVMKESGGNYNARNGRYIGAYQLTNTYLNGDYSPENQDRVAEQYVRNRYGSWMNAANFWVSHGWY